MKTQNKNNPKRTETEDTITIEGDLILTENTKFTKHLIVKGDIKGYWNLNCWNLDCRNLNCCNLNCWNLNCWNLNCLNLNCRNLNCLNLNCWNLVYCEKLTRKSKDTKIKCKMLIENRSKLEVKEW